MAIGADREQGDGVDAELVGGRGVEAADRREWEAPKLSLAARALQALTAIE